jgi:glycosyltransferase involved in cell wall biosynthesis
MNPRYVVIAPCRNEAAYMRRTLDSLVAQTTPPTLMVVVDDGSTDETPAILAEYAAKHPWIRVVTRKDRGVRSVGPGVIETFYAGLDTVNMDEFEFLCKLDLDLELPPRYFEILLERMAADPSLGTCSGKPYIPLSDGSLEPEVCGDEMSVGMTKLYRTACFRQVGGFVREVMWDGIDCHRCRMMGWSARSWNDEELRFLHLRPMGASHKGIWTGRMRHGFGQYFMGTSLAYMTASCIFRLPSSPAVVGAAAIWWGYVRAALQRKPRYSDLEFRRFLRAYQVDALLHGKAAAAERAAARGRASSASRTAAMTSTSPAPTA